MKNSRARIYLPRTSSLALKSLHALLPTPSVQELREREADGWWTTLRRVDYPLQYKLDRVSFHECCFPTSFTGLNFNEKSSTLRIFTLWCVFIRRDWKIPPRRYSQFKSETLLFQRRRSKSLDKWSKFIRKVTFRSTIVITEFNRTK